MNQILKFPHVSDDLRVPVSLKPLISNVITLHCIPISYFERKFFIILTVQYRSEDMAMVEYDLIDLLNYLFHIVSFYTPNLLLFVMRRKKLQ